MPTLGTIRLEAAKLIGAALAQGTATGGSASTLVDTSTTTNSILQSNLSTGVERFKGAYCLMTGGTVANIGQCREISDDQAGTGTEQFSKAFPSPIVAGDTYEIYAALNSDGWIDALQAGLKRCQYISKSPITMAIDGDCEAVGTAAWIGVSATLAKSATDVVTNGAQSLVVSNTGPGGYVKQAATISCTPGHSFKLWADYRVVSALGESARIRIWDETNNVVILDWQSQDPDHGLSTQGGLMTLSWNIPVNCYRMNIHLGGLEGAFTNYDTSLPYDNPETYDAGAIIAWDDIVLYDTRQLRYTLPSWLTSAEQYATLVNREGGGPLDYVYPDVSWPLEIDQDLGAAFAFRALLPQGSIARPVFLSGERPYGPLPSTLDSTIVPIDIEWAKWEVAAAAHEYFANSLSQATLARERADLADCEIRVSQLRSLFKPHKNARVGFSKPWIGSRPVSMPGTRW